MRVTDVPAIRPALEVMHIGRSPENQAPSKNFPDRLQDFTISRIGGKTTPQVFFDVSF